MERAVIGETLTHLGLDPQPPPRGKAREAGYEFAAGVAGARAGTCRRSDPPLAPGREPKGVHFAMEFLPQQNRTVAGTRTRR